MKRNGLIFLLAMVLLLIFAGCNDKNESTDNESIYLPDEISFPEVSFEEAKKGEIIFNGDAISYTGENARVEGSVIIIRAGGEYTLRGVLYDGQVIIDAGKRERVTLNLDGVVMNCDTGPVIYTKSSDKTIINLVPKKENTLSDGEKYILPAGADEPDACIFSQTDINIKGSGTLNIIAKYNKGIKSKDDLKISGGVINIKSKNAGIQGRDSVIISGGDISIVSGGDGIKTTNDKSMDKGFCSIENGTINIKTEKDGFDIVNDFIMTGGEMKVVSGGGFDSKQSLTDASRKGIKAKTAIVIEGGKIDLDCCDDGLRSSDEITISGGTVVIRSGDDGMKSDNVITINGGKIQILESKEGIESKRIFLNSGEIDISSIDDGINTTGSIGDAKSNVHLQISGAVIRLDTGGDGIDVNGSMVQTGGEVIIYGPTSNYNGSLDFDGTFSISGGTVAAFGSSAMAKAPSKDSTQCSVLIFFDKMQNAGSKFSVVNSSGKEIFSESPEKEYQSVALSLSTLEADKSYKVFVDGIEKFDFVQTSINIVVE